MPRLSFVDTTLRDGHSVLPGPFDVAQELVRFSYDWNLQVHLATRFFRVIISSVIAILLALALAMPTRRPPIASEILQRRILLVPSDASAISGQRVAGARLLCPDRHRLYDNPTVSS